MSLSDIPPVGTPEYTAWLNKPGSVQQVLADLKARGLVPSLTVDEAREMRHGPQLRDIRVQHQYSMAAIRAAVLSGPVIVAATGWAYTTLSLTSEQIESLSRAGIHWTFDR